MTSGCDGIVLWAAAVEAIRKTSGAILIVNGIPALWGSTVANAIEETAMVYLRTRK
jgi:hypothetical protein